MSDILDQLGLPDEPVGTLLGRERVTLDFSREAVERRKAERNARRKAAQYERSTGHTRRTLEHIKANALPTDRTAFDDELVEGVIGRGAMAVLYGDSNTGKTFLAIELAGTLSTGRDFLAHNTIGGIVLYLATESTASVEMRFAAWQRHHHAALVDVVIVRTPINLFHDAGDADAVVELIGTVEAEVGAKVVLVVGDTLARIAAGANENAGQDMGLVLSRAEHIRRATGITFLWVHHTGKDAAKGMRGWSGMRAAIDTEIEVTVDELTGIRTAEITKQRDLPGKGKRLGFRLQSVPMGVNAWGTERTTCVVVAADAPARPERLRGKRPSEIAGAIVEALTTHGTGMVKGRLVKHFQGRYDHSGVYREIKRMVDDGRLIQTGPVIALPGKPVLGGGAD